ncbi:hypothetical protein chiPu_0020659 [Chiloscyllium punctatum]|uniref:Uncharacterized protein n=1 Tax=Chiloscyllium punctatum TaxID=137246 RepID=A0A401RI15_CHIPU|nr:hypothetical protein [Chiloscyllium punctatum]
MNLVDLKNQGDAVREKIENAFNDLRKFLEKEEGIIKGQVEMQEEHFLQQLEESATQSGGNPVTVEHLIADIKKKLPQEDIPLLKVRRLASSF